MVITRSFQRYIKQCHVSSAITHRKRTYIYVQAYSSSSSSISKGDSKEIIYEAPMARGVRVMKGVSVTSCLLTSIGMPVLCLMNEHSASEIGKWAMCGSIMFFGLGTTSLFHYLFKPYIVRMWGLPIDKTKELTEEMQITAETISLFAQRKHHAFQLSDISPPKASMHPMVSFQAKGENYFIHQELIENEEIQKYFTGAEHRKSVD